MENSIARIDGYLICYVDKDDRHRASVEMYWELVLGRYEIVVRVEEHRVGQRPHCKSYSGFNSVGEAVVFAKSLPVPISPHLHDMALKRLFKGGQSEQNIMS